MALSPDLTMTKVKYASQNNICFIIVHQRSPRPLGYYDESKTRVIEHYRHKNGAPSTPRILDDRDLS